MTIQDILVKEGIWRTLGKPGDGKQMTFSASVMIPKRNWHKITCTACGPFEIRLDGAVLVRHE